ncbi:hypothetical protein BC936DRAFT_136898 [Jimgerdemannia flammicorona]|uniref:chitin deacetylase n=1 Tax=Jimgerdemannia flammicorona TaxID=994334 RepID=A0A433CYJ0_9FUNG|nr:hypothetical protein BC936DRAFT_136898 [Jimgerdemannia flammicorona]
MQSKFFIYAAIALLISSASAAPKSSTASAADAPSSSVASVTSAAPATTTPTSGSFTFKNTYPSAVGPLPVDPEWLKLVNFTQVPGAPYKLQAGVGPVNPTPGQNTYCSWTFTQCIRPDDITFCPTKGDWGLTYDDGPSQFSPKLYDFLDTLNQKVTLYLIGSNVIQYPDLVQRAFKAGHHIAIHTWTHSYLTTLSNEQIIAEFKWTERAIKEVIGVSPRYVRPPYGDVDDRVRNIAHQLGFVVNIWNKDTLDWSLAESKTFQAAWIDNNVTAWIAEAPNATTGSISLEHDIYSPTVDVAIKILPILKNTFNVVPVPVCLKDQTPYKEAVTYSLSGNGPAPAAASSGSSGNATATGGSPGPVSVAAASAGSAVPSASVNSTTKPSAASTSFDTKTMVMGVAAVMLSLAVVGF